MERTSNSLAQKASIISNLNPENHLSLHIAVNKYEDEQFSDAAQLLKQIHQKYPGDIAALIFLSMANAHLGKFQLAIQFLKTAAVRIHSPKTFDFYLKQIELLKRGESINFSDRGIDIHSNPISEIEPRGKFQPMNESGDYDKLIVSETLAKIYISQGELKEAIRVYEKLIEEKPENKEKYLHSIEELKSRLEN